MSPGAKSVLHALYKTLSRAAQSGFQRPATRKLRAGYRHLCLGLLWFSLLNAQALFRIGSGLVPPLQFGLRELESPGARAGHPMPGRRAYSRNPDALKAGEKVSDTLVFRLFLVVRSVF